MSRMGDLYIHIAEQAGLDPTDEAVLDRVCDAFCEADGDTVADLVDNAIDRLLVEDGVVRAAC